MPELMTKSELEKWIAAETEKTRAEIEKIRRENSYKSPEKFLRELEAAKFDPSIVYRQEMPEQ